MLNFYEQLSENEKARLLDELEEIDFSLMSRLYDMTSKPASENVSTEVEKL